MMDHRRDSEPEGFEHRRFEDSIIGKIVVSWPMIVGVCMLLVSLGINLATLWDHTQHLARIDQWHEEGRAARNQMAQAITQLTTLEGMNEKRLTSMEDWRNGVSEITPHRHRE